MCEVGVLARLLALLCLIRPALCFRRGREDSCAPLFRLQIYSDNKRGDDRHWGPMISGRDATEEETDEFFGSVFSNPLYEAKKPDSVKTEVSEFPKNLNLLKGLGRKNYQGVLDEIRNEVAVRVRRERGQQAPASTAQDTETTDEYPAGASDAKGEPTPGGDISPFKIRMTKFVARNNFKTERVLQSRHIIEGKLALMRLFCKSHA